MNEQLTRSLEKLQSELGRLAPAVDHVAAAETVTRAVQLIPEQQKQLVDTLVQEHRSQVSKSKEELASHAKELRAAISSYQESITELQVVLKQDNLTINESIKLETAEITGMRTRIREHQEVIEKINFPTRLEKLDATVSGIMAATQTTQGRVDNLERATSEKLTALTSAMEKQQTELMVTIAKANKSTRTLLFVSIVLSVIVIAAVAYLLTRT